MQGKHDLGPPIHCLGFHLGKLENFKQDIFGVVCREEHYTCVLVWAGDSGGRGQQGHPIHFYAIIPNNSNTFLRPYIILFMHWWHQEQVCSYNVNPGHYCLYIHTSPHWLNWTPNWEFWNGYYTGKSDPLWVAELIHIMKYMGMLGEVFSMM